MNQLDDGSFDFYNQGVTYRFEKINYDSHCLKRPILQAQKFLEEIEKTICDPDVTTTGPKSPQVNFYRVVSYQNVKNGRMIKCWKVVTFSRGKVFARIGTCFYRISPVQYVINGLEKPQWKKHGSLI